MMKISEKIKNIIEGILEDDEVIYKSISIEEDFFFLITKKDFIGNEDDDRYHTVGGRGILKINNNTFEFEWVHYLNSPDFGLDSKEPKYDEIINGIIKRKWINETDIFFLVNHFNFDNSDFEIYEISDVIGLKSKNNKIIKAYQSIFEKLKCNFIVKKEDNIMVSREI